MWRSDDRLKPTATKRIIFEEEHKTFRLYCGWNDVEGTPSSLYAFTISPELCLEHLYWGESLQHGFDLRYLGESARSTVFSTAELRENVAASTSTLELDVLPREPDTIDELLALWKRNRSTGSTTPTKSKHEQEEFQQRRMENLSWRMMTTHGAGPPSSITPLSSPPKPSSIRRGALVRVSSDEALSQVLVHSVADSSAETKVSMTPPSPSHVRSPTPFLSPVAARKPDEPSTVPGATPHATLSHRLLPRPAGTRGLRARSASSANLYKTAAEEDPSAIPGPAAVQWQRQRRRPAGAEGLRISPTAPLVFPTFLSPPGSPSNRRGVPPSPRGDRDRANAHSDKAAFGVGGQPAGASFEREQGAIGKGMLCVEYADHGTGDFRTPSFVVIDNANGSSITPLRYRRHRIVQGKLPMPDGLPGIRTQGSSEATTLVVTMADVASGLEVDLVYVAMHHYDVITRRAVFRNVDRAPAATAAAAGGGSSSNVRIGKVVQRACSFTVDFEHSSTPFHMLQLSGSWGRERYVNETKINHGMSSFGSMRGVSGHQHSPFAAVTVGPPSETQGEVKGFSLIYSGNFLFEAELGEIGRLRVNMGVHPASLSWYLKPQGIFNTPEAVLIRSNEGLGGMSRALHRLFLDRLIPRTWADEHPPIVLNTWEAYYFGVNHDNVVETARQAARLGIDMIVLDDGWFGKRNDISSSLGDWTPDLSKFPTGIAGLAADVNAQGCRFGLWIEPEMISEDSELHALHPDWYFRVPGRPRQVGRNQFVLDLTRREVRDYLFDAIALLLSSANIEYLKWDFNRPLTEVFSQRQQCSPDRDMAGHSLPFPEDGPGAVCEVGRPPVWQSETSHRFVLGLYELQARVTHAFPHVLLENCSSGGGRFDPGMLYYSPQVWCSDNTDALVRMKIQYGTSFAFPARCVGAHVSSVPNHITGNTTRARTRGLVAMNGTFGFELDVTELSAADRVLYKEMITVYKQYAHVINWGDLYRLWSPFAVSLAAWMYVARDKSSAVVFAFSLNSDHWSNIVPRLLLQGLLPNAVYEVSEPMPNNVAQAQGNLRIVETEARYQLGRATVCLTGQTLMHAGLPVKFFTLDDSVMFTLTQVATMTPSRSVL